MNASLPLSGSFAAILGTCLVLSPAAQGAVILDNTLDGTNPLSTSLGSITTANHNAKVFSTPASGSWALDGLKLALYSSSGAVSRTVYAQLKAVDGSNLPTGTALASESFVLSLTSTPTYYDLDLTAEDWALDPNTTYALVVNSDAPTATTSWTQPPSNNTYTMSENFTYVANLRSLNAGSTWTANSYYNGLQISATAVPEPATYASIVGLAMLGLLAWRRHRAA